MRISENKKEFKVVFNKKDMEIIHKFVYSHVLFNETNELEFFNIKCGDKTIAIKFKLYDKHLKVFLKEDNIIYSKTDAFIYSCNKTIVFDKNKFFYIKNNK